MSGQRRSTKHKPIRLFTDEDLEAFKWAAWDFVRGAPMWQGRGPKPGSVRRAAVRLTAVAVAAVLGAHDRLSPDAVDPAVLTRAAWAVWAVAAVVLVGAGHWAVEWWRLKPFREEYIDPLHEELSPILWGGDPKVHADHYIQMTPDLADAADGVRIGLPAGLVGDSDKQEKIKAIVLAKLDLAQDDVTSPFKWRGRMRYLRITAKRKVPRKGEVDFAATEVYEIVATAKDSLPVIALGAPKANGDPTLITIPFDDEAPHFAVSARTRIGKSAIMRLLAAQVMHHGGRVVILDYKRRSHRWAKDLEGVEYCRSLAEIHRKLVELKDEAMLRNTLADDYPPDQEPPWQRILVICEELNSLMEELIFHWRHEVEGKGVSPAIRGIRQLGNMAGGVKIHLAAIAQLLTAQAAGGSGAGGSVARANYGIIAAAGFDQRGWKMLAGDAPMPKGKRPKGRAFFIADGGAQIIEGQAIWMTEKEARAWATSGVSSRPRPTPTRRPVAGSRGRGDADFLGKQPATVAAPPTLTLVRGEDDDFLVSIHDASSDKGLGIVTATKATLRKERVEDPAFPKPDRTHGTGNNATKLYRPETLQRWEANREANRERTRQ